MDIGSGINIFHSLQIPKIQDGTMLYNYQRCAGVKACEFLAEKLKAPHNEVNDNGLEWARLLEELAEANTFDAKN